MKAIILAAGRGSRMKTLTQDQPKCLIKVKGKALLDWQIEALRVAGISEIGVVTGYRREKLNTRGLVEFHNPLWAETNMVSSLVCAQEWLRQEPCVVTYSDIFYRPSAIESLIIRDDSLAITYDVNWLNLWVERFGDPLLDAETFRLNEVNALVEIGGKPKSIEEVQGQYMGLLKFAPRGWQEVEKILSKLSPKEKNALNMTTILQKVIDAGNVEVFAVPYADLWGEVDRSEDLAVYG